MTERIIGEYGTPGSGPLLIAVAGLHGNEKAGLAACRRVCGRLVQEQIPIQGRFVTMAGNLRALARGVRYVDRDLNRMWFEDRIAALRNSDPSLDDAEQAEQRQLLDSLEAEMGAHEGKVIVLDLHSTSADAAPFCIVSDTLQNRPLAFSLSVPVVLGLEETIHGTIQEYFGDRGYVTAAFEGGQHAHADTADRIESALWISLVTTGLVEKNRLNGFESHREHLRRASRGMPRVVEIVYRHGLANGNAFRMKAGFQNFSPVRKGQVVAHDHDGDVRAMEDGMLVMPNYQSIGDDGFFLGRTVKRFWLGLSAFVRVLQLDRIITILPGVRRHPVDKEALITDPTIARWQVMKIFHLFGFRRCDSEGEHLVFRRRPERKVR